MTDNTQAIIARHRITGEYAGIIVDNDTDMITHKIFLTREQAESGAEIMRHLTPELAEPETWLDADGRQQWVVIRTEEDGQ